MNSTKAVRGCRLALLLALGAAAGCTSRSTSPPAPHAAGGSGTTNRDAGHDSASHDARGDRRGDAPKPHDGGPFADQPAWDPVWHETKPADWPVAPKAHVDGCGQGCVVALDLVSSNRGANLHYEASPQGLVSMHAPTVLFYSRFDRDSTWILATSKTDRYGLIGPYLHGNLISISWIGPEAHSGEVRLMNVITGETKLVYRYTDPTAENPLRINLHNDKYVFWYRYGTGLMSLNMRTGERRLLNRTECEDWYATPTGLLCVASPMSFIDQETGKVSPLDPGGALQVDGNISLERDEVVWVDYRDPPGRHSSFMGHRSGGEIYVHHLLTHQTTRITHDSPDQPTAKAYPAIGKQIIVWKQLSKDYDQNPQWAQDVYGAMDLIVYDRKTRRRCRIHSDLVKYFTHMVVRGRWVFGDMGYVIGIDVDDPAIGCVPEEGP